MYVNPVFLSLSLALILSPAVQSVEGCDAPTPPLMFEGELTHAALTDYRKTIMDYMAQSKTYLDCLKAVELALPEEANNERRNELIDAHNAELDQQEKAADAYNALSKQYRAENPK